MKEKADRRRDREKGTESDRKREGEEGRKEGRKREEERRLISGGGDGTYVDLGHGDVNEGAEDNDEIKTVPGVSEIILK